jgi:hypothetical protein
MKLGGMLEELNFIYCGTVFGHILYTTRDII